MYNRVYQIRGLVSSLKRIATLLILLLIFLSACASNPDVPAVPVEPLDPNSAAGRGAALFSDKGRCATCHALEPDKVIVGPSLAGIATRAETRVPGLSPAEYLEESIIRPDAYKPPNFENLVMDATLAKTLTVDEINDLVAYLMTLK